jgi:hypothetical protein
MKDKTPSDLKRPQLESHLLNIFIYSRVIIRFIVYTSRGHDKLIPLIPRAYYNYALSLCVAPGCSINRRRDVPRGETVCVYFLLREVSNRSTLSIYIYFRRMCAS